MEKFKVIVTFQDQSKKIPLVVTPSADLDKFRTEEAYKRFNRTVRSVFSLPPTAKFTFHEKATGAELCSESFLSERFSKRWNLVVEGMDELLNGSGDNSPPSSVKVAPTPGNTNGLDLGLVNGYDNEEGFVSCCVDSGREVVLRQENGGFGCVLRYFIIQEDYSGDEGRSGSGVSATTGDSGDILTTLFVYKVQVGGPAARGGIKKGDKVFSINGERITSSDYNSITSLIRSAGEEMSLLLTPKSDDVLQLSGFAAIAYGEEGEYDTRHGHAVVQDVDLMCCEVAAPSERYRHGSGSSYQSGDSCSHRIIATTGSLEHMDRREGDAVKNTLPFHGYPSKEDLQRPGSSNSHDDFYITANLSELPVSPQPHQLQQKKAGSPWAVGGDVNHLLMENRSAAELQGHHPRQLSEVSVDSDQLVSSGSHHHVRQISGVSTDSSDMHYMPRKLSRDGKLFTEQELSYLGSSTTLPSACTLPSNTSSRVWSETTLPEELTSTSPTEGHLASSQSPSTGQLPQAGEIKRKSSLRKQSLEDLTRLDVDDNHTISPQSQQTGTTLGGTSQGDLTPKNQSLSQDSAGSDDVNNKRYSSQRERYRSKHRPSMVFALEHGPLLEMNRRQGRKTSSEKRHAQKLSGEIILESDEADLQFPPQLGARSYSVGTGSDLKKSHRSQSLEQLDEVAAEDPLSASNTQPNLQSQPEIMVTRMRPRPHSAGGGGRLSLRYADHFGPLSRKVERDESGRKSKTKNYFVVLKGTKMLFYKDQEDAEAGGAGHVDPIDLVGAYAGIPEDYHKKTHVFKIVTSTGIEMLFQADGNKSVEKWLEMIRIKAGVEDIASTPFLSVDNYVETGKNGSNSRRGSSSKGEDSGSKILNKIRKKKTTSGSDDSTVTFGVPLEQCPKSNSNPCLPRVVELCTSEIENRGLECKGLYRMQGNESVVSLLISEMNKGNFDAASITDEWEDIIVVTTLMKRFLKHLPDSLIPAAMYHDFITAARSPNSEVLVKRVKELIGHLTPVHYHTLHHIVRHFGKIVEHSEHNLMTSSNLAIVFSPTFLRGPNNEALLKDMEPGCKLIEALIVHTEKLFDQEPPRPPKLRHQRTMSDEPSNTSGSKSSKTSSMKRNALSSSAIEQQAALDGKMSKSQRIHEWIRDSDFQGSQEEVEETASLGDPERTVPGSMWAPNSKPHQKRRVSHSYRLLNPGDGIPETDPPRSQPMPTIRKDSRSHKSHTIDDRQTTRLKRKQSYAHALGTGSLGPSFGSTLATMRERSQSVGESRTDDDVVKEFLGSAREPSDRMVYNFINKDATGVGNEERRNSNASNNSPFTTYQESFL